MKTGKIFWGILFLSLGIFSLLSYFGVNIYFDFDDSITIPLLLVILGLVILFKHNSIKTFFVIIAALISAYAIFNIFWDGENCSMNSVDNFSISENSDMQSQTIKMPPEIKDVNLSVIGAANKIKIKGFSSVSDLAKVKSENMSNLNVNFNVNSSSANLEVKPNEGNTRRMHHGFFNDFTLLLNEKPEWNIEIKSGANETKLDLRELKVKNIGLKTAASDVEIFIGDKQKLTNIDLQMAAMDIVIHIPKSSGCLINGNFILVSKNLPDFTKDDTGTYTSRNFSVSSQKVNISLKGTIADFTVKYY